MKIVHAADLHIDSPLLGLARCEEALAQRIRNATREAFSNVIRTCIEHEASFLVLAGDVFDGDWKDFNTGLFFLRELRRLREVGCHTLLVRGNHDAQSTVSRALRWPENVKEFSSRAAETIIFENHGVVFHGLSYPEREFNKNVVPSYPERLAGLLNIGVLHTNAGGNPDHDPYAPCAIAELVAKGYDYWALGHVHARTIHHENPWVVYPGNTQARHVRETGAKGCTVITVEGGQIESVEPVETDVVRYHVESVLLESDDNSDALSEKVRARLRDVSARTPGRLAAVRLCVEGNCQAHGAVVRNPQGILAQIHADALDVSDDLWLEKVELRTLPAVSIEALRSGSGLVADLLRRTEELRQRKDELERLAAPLQALRKKCARELDEAGLDLSDAEVLSRWMSQAEALLAQQLTEPGE